MNDNNNKILSFSYKLENKQGIEEIQYLRHHAKTTGRTFSSLMLRSITLLANELKTKHENTK